MKRKKVIKIFKQIKLLNPSELSKVRDKLMPIFLNLEKDEPYKDKNVIKMLKKRNQLLIKEHKQGKLVNAEKYLRKSLGLSRTESSKHIWGAKEVMPLLIA